MTDLSTMTVTQILVKALDDPDGSQTLSNSDVRALAESYIQVALLRDKTIAAVELLDGRAEEYETATRQYKEAVQKMEAQAIEVNRRVAQIERDRENDRRSMDAGESWKTGGDDDYDFGGSAWSPEEDPQDPSGPGGFDGGLY